MSEAKLAANRENAKKSTGPKTDAGKRRSAMNAVRHGVCAKTVCVHGEQAEHFNALVAEFAIEHRPVSSTEFALVYRMAVASWNLRRLTEAETSMIDAATFHRAFENGKWVEKRLGIGETMLKVMKDDKRFNALQIYQQRLERAFYRAMNELRRVRKEREERDRDEEDEQGPQPVDWSDVRVAEAAGAKAVEARTPTEQTNPPRETVKPVTEQTNPPREAVKTVIEQTNPNASQGVGQPLVAPATAAQRPPRCANEDRWPLSKQEIDVINTWRRTQGLTLIS